MTTPQQPTEEQMEPIPTQEEIDAVFTWNAAPWLGKSPTAPDSVRINCAKVLAEYGERLYGHEMEYFDQLNCITSAILRRAYLQATAALAASRRDAERLDWIHNNSRRRAGGDSVIHEFTTPYPDDHTIRAAIDAAEKGAAG